MVLLADLCDVEISRPPRVAVPFTLLVNCNQSARQINAKGGPPPSHVAGLQILKDLRPHERSAQLAFEVMLASVSEKARRIPSLETERLLGPPPSGTWFEQFSGAMLRAH